MVLSRRGFGYWGNALPAGINALVAGIGWFAVNSVSGALALNALTHMPEVLCLLIVVALQLAVAFLGHNLIHVFERYAFPVLVVIFLIASVVDAGQGRTRARRTTTIPGAFLIELGATFGYAVGWNPYASDYTRYFKPDTSKRAIALLGRARPVPVLRAARDRRRGGRARSQSVAYQRRTRRPAGPASSRPGSAT